MPGRGRPVLSPGGQPAWAARLLSAQIFSPNVPRPKPLKMYLDTGASSTTISPKDADETGIEAGGLPPTGRTNYGYGGRMDARKLPKACLILMSDDRQGFPVCPDHIQVNYTFSAVRRKDRDAIVHGRPSIFGAGLMVKAGFGMSASWKERTAHLTA